jgi:hypothetical protein
MMANFFKFDKVSWAVRDRVLSVSAAHVDTIEYVIPRATLNECMTGACVLAVIPLTSTERWRGIKQQQPEVSP